jgi:hypothetical protein
MLENEAFILWGRLTLINSVLHSLPMFIMFIFEIPNGVLKKIDLYRSQFFLSRR